MHHKFNADRDGSHFMVAWLPSVHYLTYPVSHDHYGHTDVSSIAELYSPRRALRLHLAR